MMPGNYPLKLYSGDSYEWQFKLWLDEGKTQPLDLTDVVPKAEIRDRPAGAEIFPITCTVVLPNIIAAGLSADTCGSLPIKNMVWDLQLTYPNGAVNTILAGAVSITEDVTDSTMEAPLEAARAMVAPLVRAVRK